MSNSYSIAEAKNQLPALIRSVEQHGPIELTRRGKAVAVLLSMHEYERLQKPKVDFWEALLAFRQRIDAEGINIDPDEIYADVRDRSAPEEPRW